MNVTRLRTCPRCAGSGVFRAKRVKAKCELCEGRGVYVPEEPLPPRARAEYERLNERGIDPPAFL